LGVKNRFNVFYTLLAVCKFILFERGILVNIKNINKMKTFTTENFDNLKKVCEKIIAISNENIDGDLMAVQLMCLGDNIKDFVENPIVKNSGVAAR